MKKIVYIENKVNYKKEISNKGSIITSKSKVQNQLNQSGGNKEKIHKKTMIIGQASNNHSSFFNQLSSGKNKFGIISNKQVPFKKNNVISIITDPKQNNQISIHKKESNLKSIPSNKHIIHKPKTNKVINISKNHNYQHKNKIFYSRPTSLSKNTQIKGNKFKQPPKNNFKIHFPKNSKYKNSIDLISNNIMKNSLRGQKREVHNQPQTDRTHYLRNGSKPKILNSHRIISTSRNSIVYISNNLRFETY